MLFRIGKLLNTLQYHVEKNIQESLYLNKEFKDSKWSFLERSVVRWSQHYKMYLVLIVVLFCLVIGDLLLLKEYVQPYKNDYFPYWAKLVDWQGGFLAGQLTIVGVVYPLVIGLIGVLFQDKSAKKTVFPIYQKYSGFMFAGLSGLTLSAFIVLGYFLQASIPTSIYVAFCISTACWLVFNIGLTTWFFIKTFRILDDSWRGNLIVRFSIHELFLADIRSRIKELYIQNATSHELLCSADEDILEVRTFKYSDDDYHSISTAISKSKIVKNIRFRLLNFAIALQTYLLKRREKKNCSLVIQPARKDKNAKEYIVAKYQGFEINPICKLLIRMSFSFSKAPKSIGLTFESMLAGFSGAANDALREDSPVEFKDALWDIIEWHQEIAGALSFTNDHGKPDNWLLLPRSSFFSRSYLDDLLFEYFRLGRAAVEKIPRSSEFYHDFLYLHKRIFSNRNEIAEREIRPLIQGSYHAWYLLMEWHSYSSNSSDVRVANKYQDILYDFVGAWETWLTYIEPRSSRSSDIEKLYLPFITHLEFTAQTVVSSLRFDNYEAAGWGVDMLNHWFEKFSSREYWSEEHIWRTKLLNHKYLALDSSGEEWQFILNGADYNPKAALNLSFRNAVFDIRVITACYLLLKPQAKDNQLLSEYVSKLLSGEVIHKTGSIRAAQFRLRSANDVLELFIRHRDYKGNGEGSYENWISSILESFSRVNEERRVSGRIYSGWGANDTKSLTRAYVEIAISFSKQKWKPSKKLEDLLLSDAFSQLDRDNLLYDLRAWLAKGEEIEDSILVEPEADLSELITNFKDSLSAVISRIEGQQRDNVVSATIDVQRLVDYGAASSAPLLQKSESEYPLSLFEKIQRVETLPDEASFIINIKDYLKERLATGLDSNRPVNEEEWLENAVRNSLKMNVLRALIGYSVSEKNVYGNLNYALLDIIELSETMACPVLFVGSRALESILDRSSYDSEISQKYGIKRLDGHGIDYICHIGRCEVYRLNFRDIERNILTSKELFKQLSLKRFEDNRYVNATFEQNPGDQQLGTLKLCFQMEVGLEDETRCVDIICDVKDEQE